MSVVREQPPAFWEFRRSPFLRGVAQALDFWGVLRRRETEALDLGVDRSWLEEAALDADWRAVTEDAARGLERFTRTHPNVSRAIR